MCIRDSFDGIRYIEPSIKRYLPDYEIIESRNDLKISREGTLESFEDPYNPYWDEQWGLKKVPLAKSNRQECGSSNN